MTTIGSQKHRDAALSMIARTGIVEHADIVNVQMVFPYRDEQFVARVDFKAVSGGGYQIFEGFLAFRVWPTSDRLGRNRVTPFFRLKPTLSRTLRKDLEEEETARRQRWRQFDDLMDLDRE